MSALRRNRDGFTLVELMISLVVFGALLTAAFNFMSAQNRAFNNGLDKMTGLQTLRFALQVLEEDIATAGTNVPGGQPPMAYAGDDVIAFMADYATRAANDPFAVFHDPDAPNGEVSAPTSGTTIPTTSYGFPDTTYMAGAAVSPAELISFWFEADTSTTRSDDYALYRRVNNASAQLVARHLLKPASGPVFRYMRITDTAIDSFPDSQIPLHHDATFHLSQNDTGSVARIDSVRAVRVNLRATNGRTGADEEIVELTRIIRMPNVEGQQLETCGDKPLLGTTLTAALGSSGTAPDLTYFVTLNWGQATDESGGEGDVMRYVIWRREPPATTWDDAYLSIPAGQPSYTYTDSDVELGKTYQYALAAQDCTPTLSSISAAASSISIPNPAP